MIKRRVTTIRRRRPYVKRNVRRPNVYRKKVYRKRRTMRPYTTVSRMPVSERLFTKLRYCDGITFTLTAADSLFVYMFQTSLYDPDLTGVGHQPLWRDTLATMYNRYRVFGIKYRIGWKNTNVNQMTLSYVKHSDNSVAESNVNTLLERNDGKMRMLDASQGRTNYITGYLSIPKCFGISKREFYDDDGFIGAIGANPTKMAFLQLYALTRNTTAIVNCMVELVYYAEFMDRVDIGTS